MTEEWDSMDNLTKMNNQNFKKVLEELWDGKGSIKLPGGWNKIKVDQSDLPGSGIYFYSIEFENQIHWKKMVITD